ncbi:MAG: hypothetical protein WD749_13940 [Phycisphaerales bacterium]
MKKLSHYGAVTALALAAAAGRADPFGQGTIVVVRVGDGVAAIGSAATTVFLEERSPVDGALIQVIALPTTVSGSNNPFTVSGSATSEAFVTLTPNNQYLVMAGYTAAPGTASITGSSPATINRVIARVDLNGLVDTSTLLNDAGGNARSATSSDGTDLFFSCSTGGFRHTTFGTSGGSTQLAAAPTNARVLNIFNNQLYGSSGSSPFANVFTIGSGVPITSGQSCTSLTGMPTASRSPYDYFFRDASTLFVADDGSVTSGNGGIQKWTFDGVTWTNAYTVVLPTATSTTSARGLTGKVDGANTLLWAVSNSGTSVYTYTDTGIAGTPALLVAPSANTVFRGLRVLPGTFGGANDGACCLPNGTCITASSAACTSQSGTYHGNGSLCANVVCIQPGACCLDSGACQVLSAAQCTAANGAYNGNGSDCGTVVCPQPGGCCLPDGTCTTLSSGQCTAAGGTFAGNGNPCPATCPNPRSGACCAGGTCTITTAAACSGTYRGDGTTCGTGACGAFGVGNLVVLEAPATVNTASGMSLREVRISDGATIQTIGLPAVQTENGNRAATINGASTTEGQLGRSSDGRYLVVMGYNLSDGTLNVSASSVSRVVARVDNAAQVDTTTAFTDGTFSGSSPRGAASVDGTAFWMTGDSPTALNRGVRYALFGANSSTMLNDVSPTNNRCVEIFGGNLYFSSGSTPSGVNRLGIGLPTTSGQGVTNQTGNADAMDFFFADATTLYTGSRAGGTGTSGITKYTFDGFEWLLAYVMNEGGTFTVPIAHMTGVSGRGGVTIYGTTGEGAAGSASPGNRLFAVTDTGPNSAFTLVATAPGTVTWKGVDIAPIAGPAACYANCDNSTTPPVLNVADFGCFLTRYAAGEAYANCDESTQPPVLNVADFGCFLTKYAAGCP